MYRPILNAQSRKYNSYKPTKYSVYLPSVQTCLKTRVSSTLCTILRYVITSFAIEMQLVTNGDKHFYRKTSKKIKCKTIANTHYPTVYHYLLNLPQNNNIQ